METYSFWQDFFATYRSSPDIIKALWLIVPPAFAAVIAWLLLKASGGKIAERNAFNVTVDATGEELPVQNRSNAQVLVFVAGRLLDRYEVPGEPDDTVRWQHRQADER